MHVHVCVCVCAHAVLHEMDLSISSPCMYTGVLRELGLRNVGALGVSGCQRYVKVFVCTEEILGETRLSYMYYAVTEIRRDKTVMCTCVQAQRSGKTRLMCTSVQAEIRRALRVVAPLTAVGVIGHGDDAHGLLGNVHPKQLHVAAHILVGSLHSPPHPVSPENVLSVHRQPKGVDGLRL